MSIIISNVECKIIAHKYALLIKHPELSEPFKMIVYSSIQQDTGKELGWIAAPEIQLRQTVDEKQEYILSNKNSTIEAAIEECLRKMAISSSKEIFYKADFDDNYNNLW